MKISFIIFTLLIILALIIPEKATAQGLIAAWPKYNSSNPTGGHPAAATAKHAQITAPTMDWKSQFDSYNDNSWFYVSAKQSTSVPVYMRNMYTRSLANGVSPPDTANDYITFTFNVPSGYELSLTKFIIRSLEDETNLRLHLRSNTDNYRYDLISSYYNQRKALQYNTNYIDMNKTISGNSFTVYTADINCKSAGYSTFNLRLYMANANSQFVYFYCTDMKDATTGSGANALPNPYPAYADYMIIFEGSLNSIYYADGSGNGSSEEQAFLIQTKEHLYNVRLNPGSYFKQIADISFDVADFQAGGAFYNNGTCWNPIGNSSTKFTGTYNAQGHTVSGLKINDPTGSNIGLFGLIQGATISNLGVTNVNINGGNGTGGLVGDNYTSSTITNCYTTGSVAGTSNVGGLVGINQNALVSNSYSTCTVAGTNTNIGGLVGDNNGSTITKSYSNGAVSGTDVVGGLIGFNRNTTTVNNNYSRGNVTRISGILTYIGGFCGNNSSATINYCYSTGSVSYTGSTNPSDKGFVGYTSAGTYNANFFNNETSVQTTGSGADAKNTTELKTQSTFSAAGWDAGIWNIGNGINDGYPYLAWQNPSGSPLPVELTSFTAAANESNVILNWQTATEVNNYGFNVETRHPAVAGQVTSSLQWEKIGFIQGHGNSNSPKSYSFTDVNPPSGKVQYRLKQIDFDGKYEYSDVVEVNVETPANFSLNQNYPNPCNPTTVISYKVQAANHVTIKVYDLLGRDVVTLVDELQPAGSYVKTFHGTSLPSGIYFYTMNAGNYTSTKKMILMK